ncbi:hypothetical protein, partial [Flavobacterium sp.]|uniref:hypothetical protein n=1 Tax=Flavobacterium sp. TaxID=239 RepID=UPI0031E10C00
MKRIIILSLICLSSCSGYQKFDYNKSNNPWITAFKDNVFFSCLKEGYQSDTIFQLLEQKDAFNPYDGLSLDAINETRRIAKEFIKNMP